MELSIAETQSGRLRGTSAASDVWGFFGLPYAAPPVGALRWRPPQAPVAWAGVRDAATFGADPVQLPGIRVSRALSMSDDCLYLNVWAPKEKREGGWPVLIWSCGGAFTTGSGAFAEEDPVKLAAKGAVVVSFNFRLNIFGFLAHPGLSAESPHGSSGNYGLHDQAAAFAWVRENIETFNGDSSRITFFGQSAGATVGALLLGSPIVDRPYDRVILQSPGSFSALLPLREAERHGAALGSDLEALRAIPASELLEKIRALPAVRPSLWLARPLRPIVDGWLITADDPLSGNFQAVPAIIGTNEDEGRFFAPRMGVKTVEDYHAFIGGIFGEQAEAALARYPVSDESEVAAMFSAVFGDRAFNYPIDRLARAFARTGADVYRYVYSYRHGNSACAPTHSDETGVLMDVLPHHSPEDAAMADMMARYWIAFAETGSPNGSGRAEWPKYDEAGDQYLKLDIPPSTRAAWRSDEIGFVAGHKAD